MSSQHVSQAEKLELLQYLLAEEGIDTQRSMMILPQSIHNDAPLSFAQQRLWFLDQFEPNNAFYNIPLALHLQGPLDNDALVWSMQTIVARHEVLRTTFEAIQGEPRQIIAPEQILPISVLDLQDLPSAQRIPQAHRVIMAEAHRPFSLADGPLLRVTLLRLATDDHVFVLIMHHIVSDAWSRGVLLHELSSLYQAYVAGGREQATAVLSALPIQYADFAIWQRDYLKGQVLEQQRAYWRTQLASLEELSVPADYPRPTSQTFEGDTVSFQVSDDVSRGINALCRQESTTPFMVIVMAAQLILSRYSGQKDIVIGTTIANRSQAQVENLIGFFVNTVVLRTKIDDGLTVRMLLRKVREVTLGAYAHQDLPFEMIVEDAQPMRDPGRHPLFQVSITMQNAPKPQIPFANLVAEEWPVTDYTTRFDLEIHVWETSTGLKGTITYARALFHEETIQRLSRHLGHVLRQMVSDPEQLNRQISLLTEEEHRRLLSEQVATSRVPQQYRCLHRIFEEQVRRTPDAIAVVYEEVQVTYAALNARSNQVAHWLRSLGVGPEVRVALCMDRSLEMMLGILGILKAGGVYVPLDPTYPIDRLQFMLEDAHVVVLVTQHLLHVLPSTTAAVVCLDGDLPLPFSVDTVDSGVREDNAAYVIYTSGSTGRPKGVLGTHRATVNRFNWMWETYPFAAHEIACQKTSLSFVDSIWELLGPLLWGIRTVIISDILVKDPLKLVQMLGEHGVTRITLVPSLLQQVLNSHKDLQTHLPHLTHWVTSGEALSNELLQQFQHQMPGSILLNLYGSSEVSADATCYEAHTDVSLPCVPIGSSIANMQTHVFDDYQYLLPTGICGELCISGVGLARGYLDQSALTAERFVPYPFSPEVGARMYRSGDKGRYKSDGTIEFLGRFDLQVKIRGYRVELGEIEAILRQHPEVKETVVLAREDTPGDQRLVAYVVSPTSSDEQVSDLRHYLQQILPAYMVPAVFVMLEALPLTPSGKVDRQALLPPTGQRPEQKANFVAPHNYIEGVIATIWMRVLHVSKVGVDDSFFDLGGHSLLATQVIARLRDAFGFDLPIREFFEAPTIAALAEHVFAAQKTTATVSIPPLIPQEHSAAPPLSFAQQRLWFVDQLQPHSPAYNENFAIRIDGPLDHSILARGLHEIIARHEALQTIFVSIDNQPVQQRASSASFDIYVRDLRHLLSDIREDEALRLVVEESRRPFSLDKWPLLRVLLLQLDTEEHVLLLSMHQIVSDGWSMSVLVNEMAMLYAAYRDDRPSPLIPLPIQYADYAQWQRYLLAAENLAGQLTYWEQQLGGDLIVLDLPTDHPRPLHPTFKGAKKAFTLSSSLTDKLRIISREESSTLFITLLTAFKVLLYRYTEQDEVIVGTRVAGRNHTQLDSLIGFFVNALALRTNLGGAPSFRDAVQKVRDTVLDAFAHQDVPFEKLVEVLRPPRAANQHPLFQTMFVLQNTPDGDFDIPGLTIRTMDIDSGMTRYDVDLSIVENEDGTLTGLLIFSTDIFDAQTMDHLIGHYQRILESVVQNPEQSIADIPLLTPLERDRLRAFSHPVPYPYTDGRTLDDLLREQVVRSPDAIAVMYRDDYLTYRLLNERVDRLAYHLTLHGVGPEVLVMVYAERSLHTLVALCAILRAGGVYAPLDPSYPTLYLARIVDEAQAPIMLTERRLHERLPQHDAITIDIDADLSTMQLPIRHYFAPRPTPDNLACVMYTSGSTGQAKGVAIPHRQLLNRCAWMWRAQRYAVDDIACQRTSANFSVSITEFLAPILQGIPLVIIPEEVARDPGALIDMLATHKVTRITVVPSLLRALVDTGINLQDAMPHLRFWSTCGESLPTELWERFVQMAPHVTLINQFGASEVNEIATYDTQSYRGDQPLVFVGSPIDNVSVQLLDSRLQVVPLGILGQLYVGGAGLARGYRCRPAWTAESFVPEPSGVGPDARLYNTRDLARFTNDGVLAHGGRQDAQIKVRGMRVDLRYIEAILCEHAHIKQALVTVSEESERRQHLLAYLVHDATMTVSIADVRVHMRERVPYYMVPNEILVLDALPLTPNGKIDRQALRLLHHTEVIVERSQPENPLERLIYTVWREVLQVKDFAVTDNFFDLGGHSLLLTEMRNRIQDVVQKDVSIVDMFQYPTVRALADYLHRKEDTELTPRSIDDIASTRRASRQRRRQQRLTDAMPPT